MTGADANRRRAALGRGLGALLGDVDREEPVALTTVADTVGDMRHDTRSSNVTDGLAQIEIGSIEAHPDNPRVKFDHGALQDLAGSIAARGVIQPIIVRPLGGTRYQLVAGERRWRAAQIAGVQNIPAIVRQLEDKDVTALALIENIQRENLNPVEEARAYSRLVDQNRMSQAEIATLVNKSRSHVANLMRLLALPDGVLELVEQDQLSMGHARALINCEAAEEIAQNTVQRDLSVREVEKLVRRRSAPNRETPRRSARPPTHEGAADLLAIQTQLQEFLGLNVQISMANENSGTVNVEFKTLDQLDMICQRLSGGEI
ncbi:ParB/RepB/Spo0J family partition protein [Croceicoccus sp. F390]|uniref:ParB/RepB/Spo0J family partition protein n=1 Tax=Croceicoccus esteveae TaxID=3075597 RepID=A0ABU2ZKB5_9SPHN|nr:ParB/RepB/Spo0J family partition protein [Croceicoccus sp. F390]MDT0577047.1 ParB/RepB/Spo0J family partition protein [Croceicoccus sp. F390]